VNYHAKSTDKELRQGCLDGDRRAREFFYRRYYGKLVGIPLRYTNGREDANQVLNQAFLRIFSSLDSYREEGSFEGWLSTIVFRTTMSWLRGQKQKYVTVPIDESPYEPPVSGGVDEQYDTDEIYRHIQRLPAPLRSVFCLYVVDDFSHNEIAKILGITVVNSRWRLGQARLKLRASLRPDQQKTA
jgi:RNA polymerase sigma-70 factor (ECF subfamily)